MKTPYSSRRGATLEEVAALIAAGVTPSPPSNIISTPTTIEADTSFIIASYLKVESDLTVSGNLMVTG